MKGNMTIVVLHEHAGVIELIEAGCAIAVSSFWARSMRSRPPRSCAA
jgi:hypothetical protein